MKDLQSALKQIRIELGDLTTFELDAIVNAANKTLLGGRGVDAAIHEAAGAELLTYCQTLDGCETGEAKISPGFKLPAENVIHAVGPVWRGGTHHEDDYLASCYRNSLIIAKENDLHSIGFPAISTGTYGYPMERAAPVAVNTAIDWLRENDYDIDVVFVCFNEVDYAAYEGVIRAVSIA